MSSWISKNAYLSRDEMENTALIIWSYFGGVKGWTRNAVAALLANMQSESTINPGIWESLDPYAGGYGLVQWTPYTKYSNWAGVGWQGNGSKQMERIIYEMNNNIQWIATAQYPMTFKAFSKSIDTPENLAYAFMYNYERPASLDQPQRRANARVWYEFLDGKPFDPVKPGGKIPIWMLFKFGR